MADKKIYRLYIAEYESMPTWIGGGGTNQNAFVKYVQPTDLYLVYKTGRRPFPPDSFKVTLDRLGDRCLFFDVTQMSDQDIHTHMINLIEQYTNRDTHVYFLCDEEDFQAVRGRVTKGAELSLLQTFRTGAIRPPAFRSDQGEKTPKPSSDNKNSGAPNAAPKSRTERERDKGSAPHDSNQKEQKKRGSKPDHRTPSRQAQPNSAKGSSPPANPSPASQNVDMLSMMMNSMGNATPPQNTPPSAQNVGDKAQQRSGDDSHKEPDKRGETEKPASQAPPASPKAGAQTSSASNQPSGNESTRSDPSPDIDASNQANARPAGNESAQPDNKSDSPAQNKSDASSNRGDKGDGNQDAQKQAGYTPKWTPPRKTTLELLEKRAFAKGQQTAAPEREYSELDDSKAQMIDLLADRTISNINLIVKGIAEKKFDFDTYMALIATLVRSTGFEDFKKCWNVVAPGKAINLNEDTYKMLQAEARYYAKVCETLYMEDQW